MTAPDLLSLAKRLVELGKDGRAPIGSDYDLAATEHGAELAAAYLALHEQHQRPRETAQSFAFAHADAGLGYFPLRVQSPRDTRDRLLDLLEALKGATP